MKKARSTLILLLFIPSFLIACGCGSPRNSLKIDIDSSGAIFYGKIIDIVAEHNFYFAGGVGFGLKYLNFEVIKSYRGLNGAQLRVTVFDDNSYSSCEGLLRGKKVGDTVLVFADYMFREHSGMIGTYMCGRHPTFQNLSPEERAFLSVDGWDDPRSHHDDPDGFLKRNYPAKNPASTLEPPKKNPQMAIFIGSIALNVVLSLLLIAIRNKT
ncbi:MAG: hypothetical protein SFV55_25990 [Haliscomenobacter sp.]|uniref:hypothetical protein n=1 Tax=Haliscomenobacter sp. TaxID=2717303 RepID=UPI0029B72AA9|nr:hypothetical protein [Haliscomenobacter sp.]MDX2071912.1 hypothetical protein [Haliscomenobacter sp.]